MPWNLAEAGKTPLAVEGLWDVEKPPQAIGSQVLGFSFAGLGVQPSAHFPCAHSGGLTSSRLPLHYRRGKVIKKLRYNT